MIHFTLHRRGSFCAACLGLVLTALLAFACVLAALRYGKLLSTRTPSRALPDFAWDER